MSGAGSGGARGPASGGRVGWSDGRRRAGARGGEARAGAGERREDLGTRARASARGQQRVQRESGSPSSVAVRGGETEGWRSPALDFPRTNRRLPPRFCSPPRRLWNPGALPFKPKLIRRLLFWSPQTRVNPQPRAIQSAVAYVLYKSSCDYTSVLVKVKKMKDARKRYFFFFDVEGLWRCFYSEWNALVHQEAA